MTTNLRPAWQEIAHTADVGIRVTAPDRRSLFETAARGLLACIGDLVPAEGASVRSVHIRLTTADAADLLRDWLAEVLHCVDPQRCTLASITFAALAETSLDATLAIVPYDEQRSLFRREVKAVTYHHLSIEPIAGGLVAEVVFDI